MSIVLVGLSFDVNPPPGVLVGGANKGLQSQADGQVVDPAGGPAGFHDDEIDFVVFEDGCEIVSIGCGVEK